MREFKIRCPRCQKGLRASVSGQQEMVQLQCPSCGGAIKFNLPRQGARTTEQPAPTQVEDPLDFLNSAQQSLPPEASWGNSPVQHTLANHPYGRPWNQQTKSRINLRLFGWIGAAAASCFGIATVLVLCWPSSDGALFNWGQSETANRDGSDEGHRLPTLPNLPRPESVATVQGVVDALSRKTEQAVASLAENELATVGADRLLDMEPQFRELFYRAAQAIPESRSMTDVVEQDAKLAAEVARTQQTAGNNSPPANYIWRLNSTNGAGDRWGSATNTISSAKIRTEAALWSRVRYPDPLKETSEAFDWSSEDRRVLSAYWLQGELERDVISELIACLREKQSVKQLQDRCFAVIERFYQPARDLAAVKSTQGTMLIREPKASPYARHARATRSALLELQVRFPEEDIVWIINQTKYFSDAIEELQFGRPAKVETFVAHSVRERLDAMEALVEQERQQKLAAAEQAQKEQAKQEELRQAKAAAEKEKQRQLAEAQKAKNSKAEPGDPTDNAPPPQQPLAGGPGMRPLGMGAGRPPIGMGRGSGEQGGVGLPRGSDGGPASGFGAPPSISGRNGESAGPGGRGPVQPPAMGPSVTIRLSGTANMDVGAYLEKLKTTLQTGNFQMSHSGGEATIVLGFAGELQTVIDAIDFGKVEAADSDKREIRVKIQ